MGDEILLGQHLLLQLTGCNLRVLEDKAKIRQALLNCAQLTNSRVMTETFHSYSPQGITGVVVIAESHISIHTWPEHEAAVIDFFSCNLNCDFDEVTQYLKGFFFAREVRSQVVARTIEKKSSKVWPVGGKISTK